MFKKTLRAIRALKYYVVADATDNSVTFSSRLFRKIRAEGLGDGKVMTFRLSGSGEYAFALNPQLEQETQLADIQVNGKYGCVGFEMLVPTVNRIFFDYGLPHDSKCKLSIERRVAGNGMVYWAIQRPYKK